MEVLGAETEIVKKKMYENLFREKEWLKGVCIIVKMRQMNSIEGR